MHKGIQDVGVFPTWDRFALLYEVHSIWAVTSAVYLKPFFQAHGEFEMYVNNEAPVLVSPLIWCLQFRHFRKKIRSPAFTVCPYTSKVVVSLL